MGDDSGPTKKDLAFLALKALVNKKYQSKNSLNALKGKLKCHSMSFKIPLSDGEKQLSK